MKTDEKGVSNMQNRITENGLEYTLVGNYYLPHLFPPEEHHPIEKLGPDALGVSQNRAPDPFSKPDPQWESPDISR